MMEAASTFETSVNFYQITRRKNPEDSHLQQTTALQATYFVHHTSIVESLRRFLRTFFVSKHTSRKGVTLRGQSVV
jgi:hypothetical protein